MASQCPPRPLSVEYIGAQVHVTPVSLRAQPAGDESVVKLGHDEPIAFTQRYSILHTSVECPNAGKAGLTVELESPAPATAGLSPRVDSAATSADDTTASSDIMEADMVEI
jgi:hypothetical protein